MRTLITLVATTVAACVVAFPYDFEDRQDPLQEDIEQMSPETYFSSLMIPKYVIPRKKILATESKPLLHEWVKRALDFIHDIERKREESIDYDNGERWMDFASRQSYELNTASTSPPGVEIAYTMDPEAPLEIELNTLEVIDNNTFALTPHDKGYFDEYVQPSIYVSKGYPNKNKKNEIGNIMSEDIFKTLISEMPRQVRQNPNLSKAKTLVAGNLGRFRTVFPRDDISSTVGPEKTNLHMTDTVEPIESIYGIILIAGVCVVLTVVVVGLAFGWYTLSKKAKAAADVDYPAYGVTGPTIDISGDRKLADSAHMYHYHHQKQQIIAMERCAMEQSTGSVSDPESEEENEEGDYTVYECPGFATTGDMEVKNPMFTDEPTPATPANSEVQKPKPEE